MTAKTSITIVGAVLGDALRAALSTLDGAADGTILEEQVLEHLGQWAAAFEIHRGRLPDSAQHLGRSVRNALGEALGGIAMSSVDKRMVGLRLSEHDEQWNETGRRTWCIASLGSKSGRGPSLGVSVLGACSRSIRGSRHNKHEA